MIFHLSPKFKQNTESSVKALAWKTFIDFIDTLDLKFNSVEKRYYINSVNDLGLVDVAQPTCRFNLSQIIRLFKIS